MVSPRIQTAVRDWLIERNLKFAVTINDVAKLIYQHEHSHKSIVKNKYQTTATHEDFGKSSEDDIFQRLNRLRDMPIEEDVEGIKFGDYFFLF